MTQPQREALIDLLHFSLLADSHISLKEESSLSTAIEALGWDSTKPRDIHILNSINQARSATESDAAAADFIKTRAAQFDTDYAQIEAIRALKTLLAADGVSEQETAFIQLLTSHFPL